MAEHLTVKQREFIAMCDCQICDGFGADLKWRKRQIPYHFGPMEWDDWGFRSQSDAMRFVDRLVARGLVRTDKQFFYWITDAGKAAVAAAEAAIRRDVQENVIPAILEREAEQRANVDRLLKTPRRA